MATGDAPDVSAVTERIADLERRLNWLTLENLRLINALRESFVSDSRQQFVGLDPEKMPQLFTALGEVFDEIFENVTK